MGTKTPKCMHGEDQPRQTYLTNTTQLQDKLAKLKRRVRKGERREERGEKGKEKGKIR